MKACRWPWPHRRYSIPLGGSVERTAFLSATASSGSRLELATSFCALGRALTGRVHGPPSMPSQSLGSWLHRKDLSCHPASHAATLLFSMSQFHAHTYVSPVVSGLLLCFEGV